MQLKSKSFEIILGVIAAAVIAVGLIAMFVSLDTDTETVSIENGQWTCKIASSNGFGYCLDDLATELGLEATYSVQSDDACYYVRQHGGSELWAQMNGNAGEFQRNLLVQVENDAVRAQKNEHFSDASPARQVFESIGMPYHRELTALGTFRSVGTVSIDLDQLRNDTESQQKITDYITSVLERDGTAIATFYYEDPVDSGLVKRVNISDKLNIYVMSEGLKSELEARDNIVHVHCKG